MSDILSESYAYFRSHGISISGITHRGALNVVMKGRSTGRDLAAKILMEDREELRNNFRCEVKILRHLKGAKGIPVIRVHDEFKGHPFHVCDWTYGRSFEQHVCVCASVADAARLALEACEVVDQLHSAGIVHRDISPDHLIRDQDTSLIDFGMARFTRKLSRQQRAKYVSYDVQALGLVFWEMIAGRRMFYYRNASLNLQLEQKTCAIPTSIPAAIRTLLLRIANTDSEFRAGRRNDAGIRSLGHLRDLLEPLQHVESECSS